MLRIGLTGDLGSGKSTVARLLAAHGATVLSSDEMARAMMRPGHTLFNEIVSRFGPTVVAPDGALDRRALARIAFDPRHPRIDELNALVHPAVIAAQLRAIQLLAQTEPHAIVAVESALLFTTPHAPGNLTPRERFDRIVLVTAVESAKIERFIQRASNGAHLTPEERAALEADARQRLALQRSNAEHAGEALVLPNDGTPGELAARVETLWQELVAAERAQQPA